MTETQAARLLIEEVPRQLNAAGAGEKVSAAANRLALLVNSVPSLQAFLADFAVYDAGEGGPKAGG
jgi:hypothetical protein